MVCINRLSAEYDLVIHEGAALTVVLASEGYPGTPITGREIIGLDEIHHEFYTMQQPEKSGEIQSTGGRFGLYRPW